MKNNILIFFCLILYNNSYSSSVPSASFRKLIQYSEYIIVAKVSNPEIKTHNDTSHFKIDNKDTFIVTSRPIPKKYSATIELTVLCKLKGDLNDGQIIKVENMGYVSHNAYLLSKDKAKYPDNSIVIGFLGKEDTSIVFYTIGASNGSKLMHNEEDLSLYKQRILEYLDILKIKSKRKKKDATVEWLLKCIEIKCTRSDAIYEFPRHNYFDTYNETSNKEQLSIKLTKAQKKRIDSTFFSSDTIGYDELHLVDLILRNNNTKLIKHLLKGLLLANDNRLSHEIMRTIINIRPISRELQSLYVESANIEYDDVVNQKLLIEKFINVAKRELEKH